MPKYAIIHCMNQGHYDNGSGHRLQDDCLEPWGAEHDFDKRAEYHRAHAHRAHAVVYPDGYYRAECECGWIGRRFYWGGMDTIVECRTQALMFAERHVSEEEVKQAFADRNKK